MNNLRIALDLEGVLADTHVPVIDHSDMLTEESFHEWDFADDELDEFLDTLVHVWAEHTFDIPPSEEGLAEKVDTLRMMGHDVDLVTNTPGASNDVIPWLEYHGIECDRYRFPGPETNKEELDYDIYIDDNPYMVGEAEFLYFVTTPWNDHMTFESEEHDDTLYYDRTADEAVVYGQDGRSTTVRVGSLDDVIHDLQDRMVGEMTEI